MQSMYSATTALLLVRVGVRDNLICWNESCIEGTEPIHALLQQAINDSTLPSICYMVFIPALTQP